MVVNYIAASRYGCALHYYQYELLAGLGTNDASVLCVNVWASEARDGGLRQASSASPKKDVRIRHTKITHKKTHVKGVKDVRGTGKYCLKSLRALKSLGGGCDHF